MYIMTIEVESPYHLCNRSTTVTSIYEYKIESGVETNGFDYKTYYNTTSGNTYPNNRHEIILDIIIERLYHLFPLLSSSVYDKPISETSNTMSSIIWRRKYRELDQIKVSVRNNVIDVVVPLVNTRDSFKTTFDIQRDMFDSNTLYNFFCNHFDQPYIQRYY